MLPKKLAVTFVAAHAIGCAPSAPATAPATSPTTRAAATVASPMRDGTLISEERCPLPTEDEKIARSALPFRKHTHGQDQPHAAVDAAAPPAPTVAPASPAEVASLRALVAEGRCRKVRYASGGFSVVGFVLEPRGPGHHPVVLVARGGNSMMGLIGPRMLLEMNQLVERGFVVLATQYRGSDGGEGVDQFGGGDTQDLASLVPLARSLPSVEPGDPFVLGYSRGGMTAALALRRGLRVRAAALFSGLFDLERDAREHPEMAENYRELVPGFKENPDAALRERSAVAWAPEIHAPLLLLAGTRDTVVSPANNAERLHALRRSANLESRLLTWDDGHGLDAHRVEAIDAIADWFKSHAARAP
ncbi:MAG: prolyl oligopeptidase family serine peptidase [Polyangiaceae bacterium]|nr:prolyl oligopeptidase family serine peptidase [Polyangiaceae bacterium]